MAITWAGNIGSDDTVPFVSSFVGFVIAVSQVVIKVAFCRVASLVGGGFESGFSTLGVVANCLV